MEGYKTLKQLMDTLFDTMDLTSYTIHEGKLGTTCTLRFRENGGDTKVDTQTKSGTFKKKNLSQIKRDKERLERYNRPQTRSQGDLNSVEVARHNDSGDSHVTFSDTDLSSTAEPCSDLGLQASPCRVDCSISPDTVHVQSTEVPSDLCMENVSNPISVDMPAIDSPDATPMATEQSTSNTDTMQNWGYCCRLPDALESDLLREHLANRYLENRPRISWAAIHCYDCLINADKLAVTKKKRMAYCATCKIYFCENCLELKSICFCNSEPSFVT